MKTCHACKEKIQPSANICPYCRTEQPNNTGVWLFVIVVLAIIGSCSD